MALAKPVEGSTRFNWTESKSLDGMKSFWYSDEEVFQIEEDLERPQNSFRLTMRVMDGKSCSAGPFHSLAAAQEAANRIWNFMLQSHIHHSQVIGGGFLGVASRQVFPNL